MRRSSGRWKKPFSPSRYSQPVNVSSCPRSSSWCSGYLVLNASSSSLSYPVRIRSLKRSSVMAIVSEGSSPRRSAKTRASSIAPPFHQFISSPIRVLSTSFSLPLVAPQFVYLGGTAADEMHHATTEVSRDDIFHSRGSEFLVKDDDHGVCAAHALRLFQFLNQGVVSGKGPASPPLPPLRTVLEVEQAASELPCGT